MNAIRIALSEFFGLFVDDGNLALYMVVLIAAITGLVKLGAVTPMDAGGMLLVGTVIVLIESLARAVRKSR
jgi:hypothetical protein